MVAIIAATCMPTAQLGRQLQQQQQAPRHSSGLNPCQITSRRAGLGSSRVQRQGKEQSWERQHTCVAQASESSELQEIDPMTGQPVEEGSTRSAVAAETLKAGGFTWAYRRAEAKLEPGGAAKTPILMLHGLGSASYSYRNTMALLGAAGHEVIAPDWIGHGSSSIPSSSQFDYTGDAYVAALEAFVTELGITQPFYLVVQGFVLGQYGLLYALKHSDAIEKLVILNTPLDIKSALRPELAVYKNPISFMRPKAGAAFDAMTYNAGGLAYSMQYKDAQVYAAPYLEPATAAAASAAIAATMEKLDWKALLLEVDDSFLTWRKPAALIFGGSDPFINLKTAFNFLESKRTCMRILQLDSKVGHCPQEDFAEAIHEALLKFLEGEEE